MPLQSHMYKSGYLQLSAWVEGGLIYVSIYVCPQEVQNTVVTKCSPLCVDYHLQHNIHHVWQTRTQIGSELPNTHTSLLQFAK